MVDILQIKVDLEDQLCLNFIVLYKNDLVELNGLITLTDYLKLSSVSPIFFLFHSTLKVYFISPF